MGCIYFETSSYYLSVNCYNFIFCIHICFSYGFYTSVEFFSYFLFIYIMNDTICVINS